MGSDRRDRSRSRGCRRERSRSRNRLACSGSRDKDRNNRHGRDRRRDSRDRKGGKDENERLSKETMKKAEGKWAENNSNSRYGLEIPDAKVKKEDSNVEVEKRVSTLVCLEH